MATIIIPSVLDGTFTNFNLLFQQGQQLAAPWWSRVAMKVMSTTGSNTYAWMKSIPGFRKWVGERVFHNLVSKATVIANEDYEDSVTVPRNAIEDEQLGTFGPMVQMLGMQGAKLPDRVLAAIILAGGTNVHYDGQTFFHNSHPIDPDDASKGTYSNDVTSFPLNSENYELARAEFMARVNENGDPMGIIPDLLVVPPQLETTAKRILQNDLLARAIGSSAAADSNPNKGTAEHLMIPELAGQPTRWYLASTKLPIKPFIFQERKTPVFVPQFSSTDPQALLYKEYRYLGDARCAGGYGFPFLVTRATA